MKIRLITAGILILLTGLKSEAQTAEPDSVKVYRLSVDQAVEYAENNNLQVKNARVGVAIQEQTNREITASAYPQLTGSISGTYNPNVATQTFPNFIAMATYGVLQQEDVRDGAGNPIVPPSDFGLIQAQFGTRYNAMAGLDLNQILFDGQVFVGLQARATSIDFQEKNVELTKEQVKANVHKIYYQLVASKYQIEILDANITRLNDLLADTKVIFENGFAERLDIDRLEVQIANLQTEKEKAIQTIGKGFLGLKMLMGMPAKDVLVLTDTLNEKEIMDGVLEAADYRYDDRVEFQYAELGRKLNEFNIKRYKLSRIPTVSLAGSYYKNAQRDKFNFFGDGDWFTISSINLRINVPIFNGFATRSRIRKAELELEQTNNRILDLQNQIDNEVESATLDYRTAIATLNNQKRNMELAQRVFEQTTKKYEAGLGSNTEINAAQTDLRIAQNNYISAMYSAIIARIDFLKATGKL